MNLSLTASYSIADTAAQVFADHRPKPDDAERGRIRTRQILRESSVAALRWLWKEGGEDGRLSVCARVGVWMRRPQADRDRAYERVRQQGRRK